MDYENFVRYHRRLTYLHSTQMYEMPLKWVTSIQVARIVGKQMDYGKFVQYYCCLTDLHSTQLLNFLMYGMPLKCVTSIRSLGH